MTKALARIYKNIVGIAIANPLSPINNLSYCILNKVENTLMEKYNIRFKLLFKY